MAELESIISRDEYAPAIPPGAPFAGLVWAQGNYSAGVRPTASYYWSSSVMDRERAYLVTFWDGTVTTLQKTEWYYSTGWNPILVWPVRDLEYATGSPVADAGPDQVVYDEAILDGSNSSDPDGHIISYAWQVQLRGDSTFNRNATGEIVTVSGLDAGFYEITLTVTDDKGAINSDSMLLAAHGPVQIGCTQTELDAANEAGYSEGYAKGLWDGDDGIHQTDIDAARDEGYSSGLLANESEFNWTTRLLKIPSVRVDDSRYSVEMEMLPDGRFGITSIEERSQ